MPDQLGTHLPPIRLPAPQPGGAVLRQPTPPSATVVPVGVTSALGGVASAPTDVDLVLVKGSDGVLRPRAGSYAAADHDHWGTPVDISSTAPTSAPVGAVHIDTTTGFIYINEGA